MTKARNLIAATSRIMRFEDVMDFYARGEPLIDIADELQISIWMVKRCVRKGRRLHDPRVTTRDQRRDRQRARKRRRLVAAMIPHMPPAEIADTLEISRRRVNQIAKEVMA